MKVLILFGVSVVLSLGMVLANPDPVCANQVCGVVPVKPVPPVTGGCKDLVARCQCDAAGQQCVWVWDCVPF